MTDDRCRCDKSIIPTALLFPITIHVGFFSWRRMRGATTVAANQIGLAIPLAVLARLGKVIK